MDTYWALLTTEADDAESAIKKIQEAIDPEKTFKWRATVADDKVFVSSRCFSMHVMERVITERNDLRVNLERFQEVCENQDKQRKEQEEAFSREKSEMEATIKELRAQVEAHEKMTLVSTISPSGKATNRTLSLNSIDEQANPGAQDVEPHNDVETPTTHPPVNRGAPMADRAVSDARAVPSKFTQHHGVSVMSPYTTPRFFARPPARQVIFTPRVLMDPPRGLPFQSSAAASGNPVRNGGSTAIDSPSLPATPVPCNPHVVKPNVNFAPSRPIRMTSDAHMNATATPPCGVGSIHQCVPQRGTPSATNSRLGLSLGLRAQLSGGLSSPRGKSDASSGFPFTEPRRNEGREEAQTGASPRGASEQQQQMFMLVQPPGLRRRSLGMPAHLSCDQPTMQQAPIEGERRIGANGHNGRFSIY